MNKGGGAQCKVNIINLPPIVITPHHVETTQKIISRLRNIYPVCFVYTNAAGSQAVAGWRDFVKEKPRGGSRGARDTQFSGW